jgi:hypothetical protein
MGTVATLRRVLDQLPDDAEVVIIPQKSKEDYLRTKFEIRLVEHFIVDGEGKSQKTHSKKIGEPTLVMMSE